VYRIIPDTTVSDQIAVLPTEALPRLAEVLATLELAPWNGRPHHEDNPTAAVRRWTFGPTTPATSSTSSSTTNGKSTSSSSNGSTPTVPDITTPNTRGHALSVDPCRSVGRGGPIRWNRDCSRSPHYPELVTSACIPAA
jgi:hypothetical protein